MVPVTEKVLYSSNARLLKILMCLCNDQSWTKHPSLCCCRCYYCYLSRRYWWTFYHERIYKETRVCPILGVSSTRWIARHISADIFFRQRKEISDDLAEAHPLLLSLSLYTTAFSSPCFFPFLLPCQILFLFNFLRRDGVSQSTLDSNGSGVSRSHGSPSVSATYDSVSP